LPSFFRSAKVFAGIWDEHAIRDKTHGRLVYRHPFVGDIAVSYETLRLPDDPDEALIMHTVEEGSPSHVALQLLATWAQEGVLDKV